ncbi:MAG: LytTR family transcriptional regulator [Clostridia bacterium]|nr:LytTR family transcriptional regulator [Clostridia bacterium]
MKIELKIDSTCTEPKVLIITDKVTDDINGILKMLSSNQPESITGFYNELAVILFPSDIIRVYASGGKTYASSEQKEYTIKQRLYELENLLIRHNFVRISKSEIVNLNEVRNFDLSLTGTIRVTLSDGTITYVSRRYVSKIKQVLGL